MARNEGRFTTALRQQARNLRQAVGRARDYFTSQIDQLTGRRDTSERRLFLRTFNERGSDLISKSTNFNRFARKHSDNLVTNLNASHVGRLLMFVYSPKHAETLPYYDRLPLILYMGPADTNGHILGLNLHYLPPRLRAMLLDAIVDNEIKNKYKDNERIRFNYNIMKRASRTPLFKPCVKEYIVKGNYVKSKFVQIPPDEWEEVLLLPFERFEKADKRSVWRDSISKIRKQ